MCVLMCVCGGVLDPAERRCWVVLGGVRMGWRDGIHTVPIRVGLFRVWECGVVQHLGHTGPDGNASPPTPLSKSLMEHLWDSTQKDTRRNTHTAFHMYILRISHTDIFL